MGTSAGQSPDPIKLPITSVKRQFVLQTQEKKSSFLSMTKEILYQLPQPRESLLSLGLDTALVERHACTPVGGRLAQFVHNWSCLTREPWVLSTVQGYQLPLNRWPHYSVAPHMQLKEEQSQALKAEVKSLVEKGAVIPVCESQVHLASPLL